MQKNSTLLIVLTLVSVLLFALPTMADTKPAPSNKMSDQNMSGHSSPETAHGDSPAEVTIAKGDKFEVSVQADPEKPAPNKPVNIMVIVKNPVTGEPVLDASVNVEMMLMDSSTHSNMSRFNIK